ncbi:hypothetical protein [Candidatus Synchoanobacter obligatus]|uniref:DNA-directed DNA polymerase n=1 Tax=Candidatus Synchoanobacter obligatus TaxID=2919597 RepID=A0ABT1L4A5_9GAMM|nr:hypothetical protein [Candidatus Synchoanobacter obligatus]MCP8351766.1 hypothetical protein [Candidatus Synchoanobacter obligatus]
MHCILSRLKNIQASGRLGHAYIFEGIPDSGRQSLTQSLAEIIEASIADTHHIVPNGHAIKVDQIRALQNRLSRKPAKNYHVVAISPADEMNTAASNAILKLLEEPPGATCFMLFVMNRRHLLPTIRSRAQLLQYTPDHLLEWELHPSFHEISSIYGMNQALLSSYDSEPLGLRLYQEVFCNSDPVEAIQSFSGSAVKDVLAVAVMLMAHIVRNHARVELWSIYDELCTLNRVYSYSQNLNTANTLDQIAFTFIKVKTLIPENPL